MKLTAEERDRLRPSVDVAALEAYLLAASAVPRRAILVHFAAKITRDDVADVVDELRAIGATVDDEHSSGDVGTPIPRFTRDGPGPWDLGLTRDDAGTAIPRSARDDGGRSLSFITVPHDQFIVQIEAPEDPELRRLWDAIERRR